VEEMCPDGGRWWQIVVYDSFWFDAVAVLKTRQIRQMLCRIIRLRGNPGALRRAL